MSISQYLLEPHARHIGSAVLYLNADGSWSVGPNTGNLVKVSYDTIRSIDDSTFGFSALAAERDGAGYRLWVRSDAQNDTIVEVRLNAAGQADPASVKVLTPAELFAAEDQWKLDLNDSGSFGSDPVLLEGGAVNLYMDAVGAYQLGSTTLRLGGAALTDELMPAGWEIVEAQPSAQGYTVYAMDPAGNVFAARFSTSGEYTGGDMLSAAQLEALEVEQGLDIDGDSDVPAPAGWTSLLGDAKLRSLVEAALAPNPGPLSAPQALADGTAAPANTALANASQMTHAELVAAMRTIIQDHKNAGNTPITAAEVQSLQALAARGKAVFADGNSQKGDYLAYVFGRMVESSDANRFFTGGEQQRSELGSLRADMPLAQFERLVDKWLLGGDLPNPATAGDSATGKAQQVTAVYARSEGTLFVDGVTLADVNQGSAGDCYVIAVFAGLAGASPQTITQMVVENPAIDGMRSWGVRFLDVNGMAHWVTVNDMLPTRPDDRTKLAYAGPADKSLNGEIWVPLLEKAYAQANTLGILPRNENTGQNSFFAIEGGGGDPLAQMLPGKAIQFTVTADPAKQITAPIAGNPFVTYQGVNAGDASAVANLVNTLKTAINAGKVVWIGVETTVRDTHGNQLLVGSHAHYALDANASDPANETVLVYNPWGLQNLPEPPGPTPAQFLSPVPYTLTQLVGVAGLDFVILDAPAG